MRITTKVIQNNTLSNINNNKVLQDKLSNQMSTEKKINRPSDDPVVAIRALRLRTNVNQVTQYYEKNIPDAESWMQITEDALNGVSDVVSDMINQCRKGSSEKLATADRKIILDALTNLRTEVYNGGDADYAGRSVFTGYRTDMTLRFQESHDDKKYSITEQLENTKVEKLKYIDTANLLDITEANFDSGAQAGIVEGQVDEYDFYRIRLSYDNLDDAVPIITTYDGTSIATTTVVSKDDNPSPYINASKNKDDVYLIKETGELLIGENIHKQLMELKDDPTTSKYNEGEIRITYEKTNWKKNDLKPEHYFACTDMSDANPVNHIVYNEEYLVSAEREKQAIEYDVGLNQSIKVNTTADEVFSHDIGRDVDDLVGIMQEVMLMEEKITQLTKMKEDNAADKTKTAIIDNQLDAANKALVFMKEKCTTMFGEGITKMQTHLNNVSYAITGLGTRGKTLELIENRLMSQKTSFETLQSENENVDITDVAIQLSGAKLAYEAALMATGKVLQTSLANYI